MGDFHLQDLLVRHRLDAGELNSLLHEATVTGVLLLGALDGLGQYVFGRHSSVHGQITDDHVLTLVLDLDVLAVELHLRAAGDHWFGFIAIFIGDIQRGRNRHIQLL